MDESSGDDDALRKKTSRSSQRRSRERHLHPEVKVKRWMAANAKKCKHMNGLNFPFICCYQAFHFDLSMQNVFSVAMFLGT